MDPYNDKSLPTGNQPVAYHAAEHPGESFTTSGNFGNSLKPTLLQCPSHERSSTSEEAAEKEVKGADLEARLMLTLLRDRTLKTLQKELESRENQYDLTAEVERFETCWSIGVEYLTSQRSHHSKNPLLEQSFWPPQGLKVSESWIAPSTGQTATGDAKRRTIRVLILYPSEDAATDIVCEVCQSSLDSSGAGYEVLSYVPKDKVNTSSIKLRKNGQVKSCDVSTTLATALRNLRWLRRRRVLWVDTLCFSYSLHRRTRDIVDDLKNIYTHSNKVIAWLGEESDMSAMAFTLLEEFSKVKSFQDAFANNLYNEILWDSLASLLRRPWWDHFLMMQELMDGCNILLQCGSLDADWGVAIAFFQKLAQQTPIVMELATILPKSILSVICRSPTGCSVFLAASKSRDWERSPQSKKRDPWLSSIMNTEHLFVGAEIAVPGGHCPEFPAGDAETARCIDALSTEITSLLSGDGTSMGLILAMAMMTSNFGFLMSRLSIRQAGRHTRRCQKEMLQASKTSPGNLSSSTDVIEGKQFQNQVMLPSRNKGRNTSRQFVEALRYKNVLLDLVLPMSTASMTVSDEESALYKQSPEELAKSRAQDLEDSKLEVLETIARSTGGKPLSEIIDYWVHGHGKTPRRPKSWSLDDSAILIFWSRILHSLSPSPSNENAKSDQDTTINGTFVYQALTRGKKEIRILLLHPSSHEEVELHCDLLRVDLSLLASMGVKRLPFMALSYVWNDTSHIDPAPREIFLCGKKKKIQPNLFSALRRLRNPEVPTMLWVDALCINQDSTEEKNHQVLLMRSIYQQAGHVIMWLGEQEEKENDTWHAMLPLCMEDHRRLIARYGNSIDKNLRGWFDKIQKYAYDAISVSYAVALDRLLYRMYWTRVWIVQEVLVAQDATVCCGPMAASWTTLMGALGIYGTVNYITNGGYHADYKPLPRQLGDLYSKQKGNERHQLLDVLLLGKTREASRKRDYIYAFLGLTDLDEGSIKPDYGRPLQEACLDAFCWITEHSSNLDVLSYCEWETKSEATNKSSAETWPSWLPDWSRRQPKNRPPGEMTFLLTERGRRCYKASGATKQSAKISSDGKVLTVKAIVVDILGYVSEAPWPTASQANWMLYQKAWIANNINPYRTQHKFRLAFAYTTFLGQTFHSRKSLVAKNDEDKAIEKAEDTLGFKLVVMTEDSQNRQNTALHKQTLDSESMVENGERYSPSDGVREGQEPPGLKPPPDGTEQHLQDEERENKVDEGEPQRTLDAPSPVVEKIEDIPESGKGKPPAGISVLIARAAPDAQNGDTDDDSDDSDYDSEPPSETESDAEKFFRVSIEKNANRHRWSTCYHFESRFFVTAGGLIGRGGMSVKQHDLLCVFNGAKVPFVLRKNEGSKYFRIIGDAYVHGIMKGAVMREVKEKGITPIDIEII